MNNKSAISLRGLRTFCVAAEHESFRTAGDVLFITASAVSHQIKSLEQEIGQSLFERGKRDLKLTSVGRSFYEDINPLVAKLNKVATGYIKQLGRSTVRISVQPFFASEFFIPRLSQFTADNPDIDIRVGTSDETTEHHPPTADLSIRLFRSPPKDLTSNLLFPLRMVPAGSPAFREALKVAKKKIVSEFPLIVHDSRPKAWSHWSASSGIDLPDDSKTTQLESMIAIVRAAEQGIGAALVPIPLANLWFEQGSIVRLFKQEYVADVSYYLVCRDDKCGDPNVQRLRTWILQNFVEPT